MLEDSKTAVGSGMTRLGRDPIAPAWHKAIVVLFLLGLIALSMHAVRARPVGNKPSRLPAYLITIAAEWLMLGFIALGTRWKGASMRTLVGENRLRSRFMVRDLGLAVAFLLAANTVLIGVSYVVGRLMRPAATDALKTLLPQSRLEAAAFLLLALTAGVCEEVIFRGYLQRQFTAWTRSAAAGIAVQGVAFGLAHAYQGSAQMILIAGYGCMFGMLARWRGSLRPGMLAHFLQDGVGGLLLARLLK